MRGEAEGRLLRLAAPISFWGGVDPITGCVCDPRHPDHGNCISHRVLAIGATIGSSSSSAIMLELLRNGTAPAALLLARHDAILVLGVLVARELGYPTIPVVELTSAALAGLPTEGNATVSEDGKLRFTPPS